MDYVHTCSTELSFGSVRVLSDIFLKWIVNEFLVGPSVQHIATPLVSHNDIAILNKLLQFAIMFFLKNFITALRNKS